MYFFPDVVFFRRQQRMDSLVCIYLSIYTSAPFLDSLSFFYFERRNYIYLNDQDWRSNKVTNYVAPWSMNNKVSEFGLGARFGEGALPHYGVCHSVFYGFPQSVLADILNTSLPLFSSFPLLSFSLSLIHSLDPYPPVSIYLHAPEIILYVLTNLIPDC